MPEILAKRWGIGLLAAKNTIDDTTQTGMRNVLAPAERKVRKKAPWLKSPSLTCKLYLDQFFSKLKSVHGDTGGSIFTNGQGFDVFYALEKKSEHPNAERPSSMWKDPRQIYRHYVSSTTTKWSTATC
jgi:hypothetical protein